MLLFSFCFVCVCVYWRSPQHTHTYTRLQIGSVTHAHQVLSEHLSVCVCVLLFFFLVCSPWCAQSEGAAVVAACLILRQLLKFVYQTHTHTHLRMSIFCQKMCSCYSHTHTHTLGARIKCERRNFWLSEHLSLPAAFSYISLCLCHSNYLLLLRQCLRRVCNIASPFAQAAF